jgi:predicted amidohydrolase
LLRKDYPGITNEIKHHYIWFVLFYYQFADYFEIGQAPKPMRQHIKFLSICFTLYSLFSHLTIGQLAGQVNEGSSLIVLSGLQMNVTNNINGNKEQILSGIRRAAQEGASFLVTPEGSLSGYTGNFNQGEVKVALEEIVSVAGKMKVGLMLGTCYKELIKGEEFCYNQVRVYTPEGYFMGAYSKILRCSNMDLPGTGEMVDYVEGELKTFNWNGIRFGILICNDLWATPGYTTTPNPYLAWKLKQMGAQFIIHCINSGTVQKYRPFHESSAELWAFSMQIPILEVNAAHEKETINAQSGLIDANGERSLRIPDSGTQFFTARIYIPLNGETTKHE